MAIRVPVGYELFDEIRERGSYYVDKTELIYELLNETEDKVVLIMRPRRFGKTLNMNMIRCFLDINRDSGKYFQGLAISKHDEFCRQWMNQYPVVFITLKDVANLYFDNAYALLKSLISDMYGKHSYLLEDDKVNQKDKEIFQHLYYNKANDEEIQNSIVTLMRMLNAYHGKKGNII